MNDRPEVTDEHRADVTRYGWQTFCSVDASIRLHGKLGITEPWNEWEWPRRIAANAAVTAKAEQLTLAGAQTERTE